MKNLKTFEKVMLIVGWILLLTFGALIVNDYNEIKPFAAITVWLGELFLIFNLVWLGMSVSKERGEQQRIEDYNELRKQALLSNLSSKLETERTRLSKTLELIITDHDLLILDEDRFTSNCADFNINNPICKKCPYK
jgi:hypothetical protein